MAGLRRRAGGSPAAIAAAPPLDDGPAAVVIDATATPRRRGGALPSVLRRRLAALSRAGVHVAVATPHPAAAAAVEPSPGPGLLRRTFAVADAYAWLAGLGVGSGLVLVLAADRPGLAAVLDGLLARQAERRVPGIDPDPGWLVGEDSTDARRLRVRETLFSVGGGGFGTRGAVEEELEGATPLVLAAGVYTGSGADQHLLPVVDWTRLAIDPPPAAYRQTLDLRTGLLRREERAADAAVPLRSVRFASASMPGVMALRVEAAPGRLRPPPLPLGATVARPHAVLRARATRTVSGVGGRAVAAAVGRRFARTRRVETLQRLVGLAAADDEAGATARAQRLLRQAEDAEFDRLLVDQRHVWARRWADVAVDIPDDPASQLAARFALFQLWSHSAHVSELAVGARGLSGPGYSGHVFWDADVFILPAMASIDPATATAMVNYRLRRLAAARRRARDEGRAGARYPWESAATGEDVTPTSGVLAGVRLPILTGTLEEHVTADVAWAADFYATWAGRELTPNRPESALLIETARYWAARCRVGGDGRAHIDHVVGPDEYHESVDDNAFTNVLARWNLRRGADLLERLGGTREPARWRRLADALVDGYDPATGRYEQFAGYFDLEPLTAGELPRRPPVAADLLLGRERVAGSQLIKQPDVLMLHHLVPDEVAAGSLAPNLDLYLPRTAHGSSLSPAVSAALLARAGRPDEALELFRIAQRIDLDDLTGDTAAGLHLAAIGGLWQCLVAGFGGVRVRRGVLAVDPSLPAAWGSLALRFRALGHRVRLAADDAGVRVRADGPMRVAVAGAPPEELVPGRELYVARKER